MGFDWSGFAGSALSGVSSFIGNLFGNDRQDKAIQAQKEENERNRQYNLMLAERQNRWNIEQWQRETAYNTPAAQRARLEAAGMNPDLAYGEGVSANVAASSPEMTSGAPSFPVDMSILAQKRTVGDMISEAMRSSVMAAQTRNIQKDTNKKDQETKNLLVENDILSADAMTRAVQNEQSIKFTDSQIYLNHSIASLNHQERELIAAKVNEVAASTDKLRILVRNKP